MGFYVRLYLCKNSHHFPLFWSRILIWLGLCFKVLATASLVFLLFLFYCLCWVLMDRSGPLISLNLLKFADLMGKNPPDLLQLNCSYLIFYDALHLFICLLAIYILSCVSYTLLLFTNFLLGYLSFFTITCKSSFEIPS